MAMLANVISFVLGGGYCRYIISNFRNISNTGWNRSSLLGLVKFAYFPFGKAVVTYDQLRSIKESKREDAGEEDMKKATELSRSALGKVVNLIWMLTFGWILGFLHIICGLLDLITIIGIPCALAHFKMVNVAMFPVGKTVVKKHIAEEIEKQIALNKI